MKIVTSVSGGKTSAYLAANYPADELVFALVTTNDPKVAFEDKAIARQVSRRIGKEFIGTVEDDEIIYTILDLEQFIGKKIHWVAGEAYEDVIKNKACGYLPNGRRSFCTTELKIRPIFHWWHEYFNAQPVMMNIGYRANEKKRADDEKLTLDENGLSSFKATFEKNKQGKNKWVTMPWRMPLYPLIEDFIYQQDIKKFWSDKNVRFAEYNNCVGCFHRSAAFLKKCLILTQISLIGLFGKNKCQRGNGRKTCPMRK